MLNLPTMFFRDSVIMLEFIEIFSIGLIFFLLWRLWKFVSPLKRLIGLLKVWEDLLTKHEATQEEKDKIIKNLREEIRKVKTEKE